MATRKDPTPLYFSRGIPPLETIPRHELREHVASAVDHDLDRIFQYAPLDRYRGDMSLREQLGAFHMVDPHRIFVGNGSLQVLGLLSSCLLRDAPAVVYVEAPTYDRAIRIFERHGARVVGFSVEEDGLDVEALRDHLRAQPPPAFFYTIPDFQNPSGVTMSEAKRRALVELATKYDFRIVEDIPYRELRYHGDPEPSLSELADHAGVITVGSLSKILSPGLRIGYAISDHATSSALAELAEATYLSPPPLCQSIAASYLAAGALQPNISRVRKILRPRHDAAVAAVRKTLGEALLAVPNGGYFIGARLNLRGTETDVISAARDDDVVLAPGSAFYPSSIMPPDGVVFIRLPFQALHQSDFVAGVARLSTVVDRINRQRAVRR